MTRTYRIPDDARRIAVFASYSKDGVIEEYVVHLLTELRKVADAIVFVADNEVSEKELKKIEGLVAHAACNRHGGYDFGSYKIGCVWLLKRGLLRKAEELILLNDSCYGPLRPFAEVFGEMEKKQCDFWGMADSYKGCHHILPFFLFFKKQVLNSVAFTNFVFGIQKKEPSGDYAEFYEKGFTSVLEEFGFKSAAYITDDASGKFSNSYYNGNDNCTLWPVTLAKAGMPLVKRKALNGGFKEYLMESPLELLNVIRGAAPTLCDIIERDIKRQNATYEDKWLLPENIVGNAEVVSFDVFDTLLARPYAKPTDLFLHMESALKADGFAKARIAAEAKARKRHKGQADVTLGQIYETINPKYRPLKEKELDFERRMLFAKKDGREIYDEAVRRGRKIIAVSDMYLPGDFIAEVLKEKGYDKVSEVFVSNEAGACKGDGELFRRVLAKLGVQPKALVHVGDNLASDKLAPEKLGIRAVHRQSNLDAVCGMRSMERLKRLAENPSLPLSFTVGILVRHFANGGDRRSPLRDFGYELGGPLAVGYVTHIHKVAEARGVDAVLFVSRDGYALYEVYKKMYPGDAIKAHYIQASRKLVLRNACRYSNKSYMESVYKLYAEECLGGVEIEEKDYPKYEPEVAEWCAENAAAYKKYVDGLGITGRKMMTVDMTTKDYTSYNVLKLVFGDRVDCGMFSMTHGDPCEGTVLSYATRNWDSKSILYLILQEELITAPHFSAYKITNDGKFLYNDFLPAERERVKDYSEILDGLLAFADDFVSMAGDFRPEILFNDWIRMKENYVSCHHYGLDAFLKSIIHEDGNGLVYGTIYDVLHNSEASKTPGDAPKLFDGAELLRLRRKYRKHLKDIRRLVWTVGIETVALLALTACLLL